MKVSLKVVAWAILGSDSIFLVIFHVYEVHILLNFC